MPKRTDINRILVIGSGPIIIGQALEFDYSGTQCCRALKDAGYEIILLNSNPATIMTDTAFADFTYIEPINIDIVKKICQIDKPDAVIASMGGQVGLNIAREIISEIPSLEILGLNESILHKAESRHGFRECMKGIKLRTPKSRIVVDTEFDVSSIAEELKLPIIIRPSFTLGGLGSSIVTNKEELRLAILDGIKASPVNSALVEESLLGQKEIELEVIRDTHDNCIMIACIENIDPMGIHTGDSIAVTPSITLRDRELQILREKAFECVRAVGAIGSCNVQFSVRKDKFEYNVIEMNPRVSRSSALTSKATGYPIARVSTMVSVGYALHEIHDELGLPYAIEPINDSVAVKIPRFSFDKFPGVDCNLTSFMKSVGEVIGVGSSFEEALQKASESLEAGRGPIDIASNIKGRDKIIKALRSRDYRRLVLVTSAIRAGIDLETVIKESMIDRWFINSIAQIIHAEQDLVKTSQIDDIWRYKRLGFSNSKIVALSGKSHEDIASMLREANIKLCYKKIDFTSGELTRGNIGLYSTYLPSGICENYDSNKKKVIIIGSGPNRIGQGIEFDYCCVNAAFTLKEMGYEAVIVNSNPSTVSTDYNVPSKLYLEPITQDSVVSIIQHEMQSGRLEGVILQLGGQTPLMISDAVVKTGAKVIGTRIECISLVEDRDKFREMVARLGIKYPDCWHIHEGDDISKVDIRYPVIVRPSYVLGGSFMEIIYSYKELVKYFKAIQDNDIHYPIIADQFLEQAIEIDIDAVCNEGQVYESIISEHIDEAGVHSGDSSCSIPPYSISPAIRHDITEITEKIAKEVMASGFINIQFAIWKSEIFILEVNLRASRSMPVVAKAIGRDLIGLGIKLMMGKDVEYQRIDQYSKYAIKVPVLTSMAKIGCYSGKIGPSMKSTGESMGIGESFHEAFLKAQIGAFVDFDAIKRDKDKYLFLSVHDNHKQYIAHMAKELYESGYKICATHNTGVIITKLGVPVVMVDKSDEVRDNTVFRMIQDNKVSAVLMTYDNDTQASRAREFARLYNVPLCTSFNVIKVLASILVKDTDFSANITKLQDIKT